VISQLVERPRVDDPLAVLTPRERDVLTLVAEGMSNEAIAQQTGLAREDVDEHVATTFSKLRLPASAEDHRRLVVALALLRT